VEVVIDNEVVFAGTFQAIAVCASVERVGSSSLVSHGPPHAGIDFGQAPGSRADQKLNAAT
jgi:hypothetical protein